MSSNKRVVDFDVRVRERNLRSGLLTSEEVQQYLEQLPDVSEQGEVLDLSQPALTGDSSAESVAPPATTEPQAQ